MIECYGQGNGTTTSEFDLNFDEQTETVRDLVHWYMVNIMYKMVLLWSPI